MDATELRNSLIALHSASFAWAMVCCRDREMAEDVLQSVYVKVLSCQAPHQGRASFRTWLFTVIRNTAHDQRRRRWWSHVMSLEFESLLGVADPDDGNVPQHDQDHQLALIRAALDALPKRQHQVAHLVFYENLTIAEAAVVMGVTLGTARQHYARAKESLRRSLQPLRHSTPAESSE